MSEIDLKKISIENLNEVDTRKKSQETLSESTEENIEFNFEVEEKQEQPKISMQGIQVAFTLMIFQTLAFNFADQAESQKTPKIKVSFIQSIIVVFYSISNTIYHQKADLFYKQLCENQKLLLIRGLNGGFGLIMTIWGIGFIPLGDYMSILGLQSLFCAMLGSCFLREKIGLEFFFQVPIILTGIVMITRPEILFGSHTDLYVNYPYQWWGVMSALTISLQSSITVLMMRKLKKCMGEVVQFANNFTSMIACAVIMLFSEYEHVERKNFIWCFIGAIFFLIFQSNLAKVGKHMEAKQLGVLMQSQIVFFQISDIIERDFIIQWYTYIGVSLIIGVNVIMVMNK